MSKHKYLVLFRNQPAGDRPAGGQSGPSPEQMQQMFAAYNAWMEKFKDDILDMGDKLKSGRPRGDRLRAWRTGRSSRPRNWWAAS